MQQTLNEFFNLKYELVGSPRRALFGGPMVHRVRLYLHAHVRINVCIHVCMRIYIYIYIYVRWIYNFIIYIYM